MRKNKIICLILIIVITAAVITFFSGCSISHDEAFSRLQTAALNSAGYRTYWWQEWHGDDGLLAPGGVHAPNLENWTFQPTRSFNRVQILNGKSGGNILADEFAIEVYLSVSRDRFHEETIIHRNRTTVYQGMSGRALPHNSNNWDIAEEWVFERRIENWANLEEDDREVRTQIDMSVSEYRQHIYNKGFSLAERMAELIVVTGNTPPEYVRVELEAGGYEIFYIPNHTNLIVPQDAAFLGTDTQLPPWASFSNTSQLGQLTEITIAVNRDHAQFTPYLEWFYQTFGYRSVFCNADTVSIEIVGERIMDVEAHRSERFLGMFNMNVQVYHMQIVYFGPNMRTDMPRFNREENGETLPWGEIVSKDELVLPRFPQFLNPEFENLNGGANS